MNALIKKSLSMLLALVMLISLFVPSVAAAESTDPTQVVRPHNGRLTRADEPYFIVDDWADLASDSYILLFDAEYSSTSSYYALTGTESTSYYCMLSLSANFSDRPAAITAPASAIWTGTYNSSNHTMTLKNSAGSYLADISTSSNKRLGLSSTAYSWTVQLFTDDTFALTSANGNVLCLRDDASTMGDNDLPMFSLSTSDDTGSCYFYLYRKTCTHNYAYSANMDGTHVAYCNYNCGYSREESCNIVNGVCTLCGYKEEAGSDDPEPSNEFTVTYVVPDGVEPIEPFVGNTVIFPIPTGTPTNNPNGATFIGWTNKPVNNSTTAPSIYDTDSTYSIPADITLYALYSYSGSHVFTLYDGTNSFYPGDKAIIVAREYDYALSKTQNNNNRAAEPITKNGNTVTIDSSSNVSILTIGWGINGDSETNKISLRDENGYLTAASSSGNYLRSSETLNENSTWTFTRDTSTHAITFTADGSYTRNIIRYNTSSTLFGCYGPTNTQKDVQLYLQSSSAGVVYTTVFDGSELPEEPCQHEFTYTSNNDGTHFVECLNGCDFGEDQGCNIVDGTCTLCGYAEDVGGGELPEPNDGFTVNFSVPDGVTEPKPLSGTSVKLPTPSGTPNLNYNNAIFVGWVASEIDNSVTAPTIYKANTEYTISSDITLHALYTYAGGIKFTRWKGAGLGIGSDRVIFVGANYNYAMSKTQNTNNRSAEPITKNGDTIIINKAGNVAIFTLDWGVNGSSESSQIAFYDDLGYLTSASSSGNYLRTSQFPDANGSWTFKYTNDYLLNLVSAGNYTRNSLRFNNSSKIFSCYESSNTTQVYLEMYTLTSEGEPIYTTVFNGLCAHLSYTVETIGATCSESGSIMHICDSCGATLKTITLDPTDHNYKSKTNAPTCTEDGNITYTCANCGDSYVEIGEPALGHSYTSTTVPPTCSSDGYTEHRCSRCGDSYIDAEVPPTNHSYRSVVTNPTCQAEGYTTYTCEDCGHSYIDDRTPVSDHNYTSEVTIQPTCDTNGLLVYTCSFCKDSYSEQIIAEGHAYDDGVTTPPTCTEDGKTVITCANCGNTIEEVILSEGHSYDDGKIISQPTCTSNGSILYTCSICKESYTETIITSGHNFVPHVYDPTCTEEGYTEYICSGCNESYITDEVSPYGHDYYSYEVEPTCDTPGYTMYECDCGDFFTLDEVDPLGHDYIYTDNGDNHLITCANCDLNDTAGHNWDNGVAMGESSCAGTSMLFTCDDCAAEKIETTAGGSHSAKHYPALAAACQQDGYIEHYRCERCNKYFMDASCSIEVPSSYVMIPGTEHSYVYIDNGANHMVTCDNCDYYEEAPHEWDNGVQIGETTCNGTSYLYTCGLCAAEKTETVGGGSHNTKFYAAVAASCGQDGNLAHYRCETCGKYFLDEACTTEVPASYVIIPSSDHSFVYIDNGANHMITCDNCDYYEEAPHEWDEGMLIGEATCNGASYLYTCDKCAAEKTETVEGGSHKVIYMNKVPATCTEAGIDEHYKCTVCGLIFLDAEANYQLPEDYIHIDATGHSYTYTPNGKLHTVACSRCSDNYTEAHTFTDGKCICGANEPTEQFVETLKPTMSIVVGAEMSVAFTVPNALVGKYESFYLVVEKDMFGAEPKTVTFGYGEGQTALTPMPNAANPFLHNASFTGLTAKEMGDEIRVTLYCKDAEGNIFYGPTQTDSVKDYLLRGLDLATSTPEKKTMYVDMLRYGAVAQTYFDYDTDNLVADDLTEEHLTYATTVIPEAVDGSKAEGGLGTLNTSVVLKARVTLTLSHLKPGANLANMKFIVKDALDGTVIKELPAYNLNPVMIAADFDDVGAKQMRRLITVTLYDGDTAITDTVTWSVESYVAKTRATSTDAGQIDLVNAMLTYGDAVAAYMATQ
ncbi:MAG: hypothetical protein E7467_09160 [Ruminococcaceae bacterium]|nr:hypothetical protein [Oscillospiraceae bacterium]